MILVDIDLPCDERRAIQDSIPPFFFVFVFVFVSVFVFVFLQRICRVMTDVRYGTPSLLSSAAHDLGGEPVIAPLPYQQCQLNDNPILYTQSENKELQKQIHTTTCGGEPVIALLPYQQCQPNDNPTLYMQNDNIEIQEQIDTCLLLQTQN